MVSLSLTHTPPPHRVRFPERVIILIKTKSQDFDGDDSSGSIVGNKLAICLFQDILLVLWISSQCQYCIS